MAEKTVGILGGLGPEATLDFYARLMQASGAEEDQDHLHVIVNSNAKIPNRQRSIAGTGSSSLPGLIDSAQALERAGADFIVMPCNTAHYYSDGIEAAISIPFLSILDVSVRACLDIVRPGASVGLMATNACLDVDLYQSALLQAGLEALLPNEAEQRQLMRDIFRLKTGEIEPAIPVNMRRLSQSLHEKGATLILTACTEIPMAFSADEAAIPVIHSTDALVEATIAFAREDEL